MISAAAVSFLRTAPFSGRFSEILKVIGILRLGPAKAFGGTIHWMVPPLCLLTLLGERFAFLFGLWGLLAPTPRRKLLKKLEQNFYVLLAIGKCLTLAHSLSNSAAL